LQPGVWDVPPLPPATKPVSTVGALIPPRRDFLLVIGKT
jgi:hypothetical protein